MVRDPLYLSTVHSYSITDAIAGFPIHCFVLTT